MKIRQDMKKIFLSIIALTLSISAWAQETQSVNYIDADGQQKTVTATVVTNETGTLSNGWYVVLGVVSRGTITCNGDVHLILADGAKLTAQGWNSSPGVHVPCGRSRLTIYGQTNQTGELTANGGDYCAGIGEKSVIDVFCSGDYSVGIGSLNGNASVKNSGTVNATADGETSTAIGTLNGAEGRIQFLSGQVKATVHCNIGCSVGSVSGRISIENTGGRTQVYGEGSRVRGFGSLKGSALCRVDGGIVTGSYLAAEGNVFGSENDRFIVNSGNIICDENTTVMYNDFGNRLTRHESDGDSFDQDILTPDGSYHYKAVRDPVTNRLSVYLPYTE